MLGPDLDELVFFTISCSSLSVLLPPTFSTAVSHGSFELCSSQPVPGRRSLPCSPCKASLSKSPGERKGMEDTAEVPRALIARSCSWKEGGGFARVIPVCRSHMHSWSLQFQRFGSKAPGVISLLTVRAASLHCCSFSMSLAGEQGGDDTYSRGAWVIIAFAAHI